MEQTSVTFEIGNLPEKSATITSPIFVSSGYEWYVEVQSCYSVIKDYLGVSLHLANPESLRSGWTRRVNYHIIMLNKSGKELMKTSQVCTPFSAKASSLGCEIFDQEKGFLQKNELIIKVKVNVVEVVYEKKRFAFFKAPHNDRKELTKAVAHGCHQVEQLEDQRVKNFTVESCLGQVVSDNKVELDKKRSVKFSTSIVASFKDALCFS